MATVTIDDVDEAVIEAHRRRAQAQGVSLQDQLRESVTRAVQPSGEELALRFREIRARNRPPPRGERWPSAEEMVREDRDSR